MQQQGQLQLMVFVVHSHRRESSQQAWLSASPGTAGHDAAAAEAAGAGEAGPTEALLPHHQGSLRVPCTPAVSKSGSGRVAEAPAKPQLQLRLHCACHAAWLQGLDASRPRRSAASPDCSPSLRRTRRSRTPCSPSPLSCSTAWPWKQHVCALLLACAKVTGLGAHRALQLARPYYNTGYHVQAVPTAACCCAEVHTGTASTGLLSGAPGCQQHDPPGRCLACASLLQVRSVVRHIEDGLQPPPAALHASVSALLIIEG